MAIKIWTTDIQKCFIWTTPVKSIWSWDTQVRPSGWWWWQPWANTIAYYPLKENLDDYSGNGYNMTNSWITFSDWVAVLDGSQRATIPNVTGYKTICLWFKKTSDYNGMIYAQGNTDGYVQLRTNGFASAWTWWGTFNADFTAWWSTPSNVWRCFVMTQTVANNSWAGTWAFDFYLSDFWWVSWIRRFDGSSTHYFNRPLATFWWSGNTSYHYAIIADVSALIIEDAQWTQQEIEDYYNLTKWNYWL